MTGPSYKLLRSATAVADIVAIQAYTVRTHGREAASAYNRLLRQAFKDIREDPFRPGSKARPEIAAGVRTYHISFSRGRAASTVRRPRHVILYYQTGEDQIAISRVLHDSRDFARHLPNLNSAPDGDE